MYTSLATQVLPIRWYGRVYPSRRPVSAGSVHPGGHEGLGVLRDTWDTHKTQAMTFRQRDE